ncbi:zinc ABC transporter substrate-binding protein [Fructobacillus sp. M1-13]|uniref:Zinc ABC transporter solute-binding protein n=1 Tax=Fructobacillus papyriferae TaxID=2713171 RepID=A0ABS5QQH9_9LACO|nr:zinc ABC transporter substrate-binding protein [Fructobacillus papyriferae]MBS9335455.1 zinc ABC transporter solute-binding protein [Fructobacillus papyriferae]MCD2159225.1 zinc ABC transporter substrate-binding protein [Fructobacillus papyriferae]
MKRTKILVGIMSVFLLVILSIALWPKHSDQKKEDGQLTIVASTNVYAELASTVAGDHANVSAIISKQSVSPEDFEPTNQVAKEVSKADIAFGNGLGYDAWLNKLTRSSKKTQLILVSQLLKKSDKDNPHLWNDPENMVQAAQQLADQLSKKDPDHKADYQKNAAAYKEKLTPVTEKVAALKSQLNGRVAFETESVYEYMLHDLGLTITGDAFAEAVGEESDPAPSVMKKIQEQMKNHEIDLVVQNTQTSGGDVAKLIKLAKQENLPIVKVTETSPDKTSYVDWKLSELNQIEKYIAS